MIVSLNKEKIKVRKFDSWKTVGPCAHIKFSRIQKSFDLKRKR